MKRLLAFLISLLLTACLVVGVLHVTGVATVQELLSLLPGDAGDALQSALDDTAQRVRAGASQLYSQLNGHEPPSGTGELLEGDLPEERIPDASDRYSFPEAIYAYRAMLSADEQAAYDQVYAYAAELYEKLPLPAPLSGDALTRVMSAFYYDHPELFWVETSYQYYYTPGGQVVAVTLNYNPAADSIDRHRALFDEAVREVVGQAKRYAVAAEQEKFVHDWLLDNVSYQLDAPLNQSAYSALIYGETVCAGYARAFQVILRELDIPVYYCAGYAGEAHAWNIVGLEDGYYHVDVTWDDPLGNTSGQRYYNYFNLTDAQIAADHSRSDLSRNLPACNATGYSYENYFAEEPEEAGSSAPEPAAQVRGLEQFGLREEDALGSLDAYYDRCREQLVARGEGTHTFSLLIRGEALIREIFDLTESREAVERYAPDAARELGFAGYSITISLQGEELVDGYWLLTQQVRFEAQRGAPQPEPPPVEPDSGLQSEPEAGREPDPDPDFGGQELPPEGEPEPPEAAGMPPEPGQSEPWPEAS